jgi:hypothetical protein
MGGDRYAGGRKLAVMKIVRRDYKAVRRLAWVAALVLFGWIHPVSALVININAAASLQGNTSALDAFNRAADQWEAIFTDDITVTIDADLLNLGASNIIAQAGSVFLNAGFDVIRDVMVADASDEADDLVVSLLPTAAQFSAVIPVGFDLSGNIAATKANLKAMGFTGLDAQFGTTDATIEFNSQFAFDFDNSNGVGAGLTDFETVAIHEIGHALGFVSVVDVIDQAINQGASGNVSINPLDLFRFSNATGNPETATEFTDFARNLVPGNDVFFDDLFTELALSEGVFNGDGRQASHWKDNNLTGSLIGVMDPTLGSQQVFAITDADIRALDVIGWDFVGAATLPGGPSFEVPAPGSALLFAMGALMVFRRRV